MLSPILPSRSFIPAAALLVPLALAPSTHLHAQSARKNNPPRKTTPDTPRPMSLDQVRKLIAIQTPDSILSQEIQTRGIAGDFSRKDIDHLRRQGAGSATLAVLTRLLPSASLTVKTEPGASVALDGAPPVQASPDGAATFSNLDPGPHQLAIRKQLFSDLLRAVELKGRDNTSIDAPLNWAVGFLSVTTNVPDATVQVAGSSGRPGALSRVPVPIGQATIVASALNRQTVAETVTIEPGKDHSITLNLPFDEAAIKSFAGRIHDAFLSHSYPTVLLQAAQFSKTGAPPDPQILADVAVSHFATDRLSDFRTAAHDALLAGGRLLFPVQHHHAHVVYMQGDVSFHPATLEVSSQSLAFRPDGNCSQHPFELPWTEVRLGDRRSVAIHPNNHMVPVLELVIANPSNPKKKTNINLFVQPAARSKAQALHDLLAPLIRQQ